MSLSEYSDTVMDLVFGRNVVVGMSSVGAKGRVLVPSEVRRAAGFKEGDDVVLRVEQTGQVIIESRDAIRNRVWAAAPGRGTTPIQGADRREEVALEERNAAARTAVGDDPDEAARRLLIALGLE